MAKSDVLVRMKADTQNYDANIAKARRQLDAFKKDNLSAGGVMKQLSGSLVATAAKFASVTAAVGLFSEALRNNIETAKNFEKSMSQLSSLTGMVGKDLERLKEYSIELGASPTLSASQVADAFKLIGSQQPQLLSSAEALKAVTKSAITLAEAAGIDLAEAAKTLSVSINQMGGDSENADRFINVLAAASQKGAGDIVWLGEAITKSGTTAKAVGTSYEELVANLEQLAKAGYDASTAGTALRSIIMNLEKQANDDFKPSVVGLTEAFNNLGKANLTLSEYQQLTGKMFAAQAMALANAAAEAANLTEQITDTNTATEQAITNTNNFEGSLKGLSSAWEGLNLHLNSSNGLLKDFVDTLTDAIRDLDTFLFKKAEAEEAPAAPQPINPLLMGGNTPIYGNTGYVEVRDSNGNLIESYTSNVDQNGNHTRPGAVTPKKKKGGTGSKNSANPADKMLAELEKAILASALNADDLKPTKGFNHQSVRDMIVANRPEGTPTPDKGLIDFSPLEKFDIEIQALTEAMMKATDPEEYQRLSKARQSKQKDRDNFTGDSKKLQELVDWGGQMMGGVNSIVSGIEGLGIEIPEGLRSILGGLNSLLSIASGISTILIAISMKPFAHGGIVPHAASGFMVPGNHFSGDVTPILANAGEVVLNKAQQGALANQLIQPAGAGGGGISRVSGEQIYVVLNRYLRRSGRGELATWG